MRTFIITAACALFFAAALLTVAQFVASTQVLLLGGLAFVAFLLNGLVAARLTASPQKPAQKPTKKARNTSRQQRPAPSRASGNAGSSANLETGEVKWFNRNKGFGFIIRENGDEIFVHQRSIARSNGSRPTLRDGQKVRFSVAEHEKGLQAENVSEA